jgi:6-phosphogluconolactonase
MTRKVNALAAALGIAVFLLASLSMAGLASAAPVSMVYVEDNASPVNHVLEYQNAPDGALALVGSVSAQGAGTGSALGSQGAVELARSGQWLLVVDAGSSQITVFRVQADGSLVVSDVVGSHGSTPISLTVSSSGHLVYVLNNDTPNIAGFTLTGDGQLSFIPGSIQALSGKPNSSPEDIGFIIINSNDSAGNLLVVTEKAAGVIDTYAVGENGIEGAPTVTVSNGAGPYGFASTFKGTLIVSEAAGDSLSSYATTVGGTIRTISGALPDFGSAPCWVAVSPNGRFVYTSNAHGGTISAYSISRDGTLSLISSIAAKTAVPTLDLTLSGNGQYLYALNGGMVTSFWVYPDGGISIVATIGGIQASAAGIAAS